MYPEKKGLIFHYISSHLYTYLPSHCCICRANMGFSVGPAMLAKAIAALLFCQPTLAGAGVILVGGRA